jgi:CheY-like chemotaxis protein
VRDLIRAILEPVGYTIVEAENGREGMCRFRESPTDAVITDVPMPDGDGWDVIRELRAEAPSLKILALPALQNPDEMLTSTERLEADAVLSKPLSVEVLRMTMETLLGPIALDDTSVR